MPSTPKATLRVSNTVGAVAAGNDVICVVAPVAQNDDGTPRLFGNVAAIYDLHGFCGGVDYASLHAERTRKSILFVGIPIETPGAIEDEDTDGNSGTCVTTVTAGADGVLTEHQGVLQIERGGTVGTDSIVLRLSCDGGRTFKRVRLGTGNSYTIPFLGAAIAFGAGTLVTGETIHTWRGTEPLSGADGWALARGKLAAQQRAFRSILLIGDLQSDTEAAAFVAEVDAYETENERFVFARASVYDQPSDETKAVWAAGVDAEFGPIDGKFRIDLSMGRGRARSPFTGWNLRRPASWAASLREYQHDLHIATWRKADGNTGFDLHDENGELVEYDDRVDGGVASAARFTSFRTWANGPLGAFISQSLTRATEGSLLGLTNNVAVLNLACSITHRLTENAIGRSLVLNEDGTATTDSLTTIQSEVNAGLENELLTDRQGEGPRASKAVWTPSADDVLNVPEATITGVLDLVLNGTVHSFLTTARVRTGGQ